jgi:hypothetical protein
MVRVTAKTTFSRDGGVTLEQVSATSMHLESVIAKQRGFIQERLVQMLIASLQEAGGPWGMTIGSLTFSEEPAFIGEP